MSRIVITVSRTFDQVEKLDCLGRPKQRFSSDFFSTDALKTYQRKSLRSKKK